MAKARSSPKKNASNLNVNKTTQVGVTSKPKEINKPMPVNRVFSKFTQAATRTKNLADPSSSESLNQPKNS